MSEFLDYEEFKAQFYKLSNIDLNMYKEKQMKRRITSFAEKYGFSSYLSFLDEIRKNRELRDVFIGYLTINVSEFYRNPAQWQIFEKKILPAAFSRKKRPEDVRIWSSACSTGEEPYTVVMIMSKFMPLERIRILATDIDQDAMEKARKGIYPERNLREIPRDMVSKYFTRLDRDMYAISDKIKQCVEFRHLNLLEDPFPREQDIILCRNVLIYFTEEAKEYLFNELSGALAPEGVLFVGSTEQIINYQKYNLKPLDTFFYQKA
jgi:CheR methyltransferase, SAM binding domain./CheR methyltransferase, all-alpha domain.